MKRAGSLVGLLMTFGMVAEAQAQIFLLPAAIAPRRIVVVSGTTTAGYLAPAGTIYYFGPYGTSTTRVTVYSPASRRLKLQDDELAGVDLDVVRPPRARPEPVPAPDESALPGKDISVPREAVRPGNREAPKPKPEPPARGAPEAQKPPVNERERWLQLGQAAFAQQQFGLASLRFEQAGTADALAARPRFLQAQALFMMGKYREAVAAIQAGLVLDPDWPRSGFRPRLEMYKGTEGELDTELKRLTEALAANPKNLNFLFLLGYQRWFEGQQGEAIALFRRARDNGADPVYLEPFLKAAPADPVAAK